MIAWKVSFAVSVKLPINTQSQKQTLISTWPVKKGTLNKVRIAFHEFYVYAIGHSKPNLNFSIRILQLPLEVASTNYHYLRCCLEYVPCAEN